MKKVPYKKLKKCSEIIKSIISKNDGRIFNTAGDAFMIEFFSPIMALNSAISIQLEINSLNSQSNDIPMEFRIGLNLGDVMIEEENLFGAGVNVAARLEGICPPRWDMHVRKNLLRGKGQKQI